MHLIFNLMFNLNFAIAIIFMPMPAPFVTILIRKDYSFANSQLGLKRRAIISSNFFSKANSAFKFLLMGSLLDYYFLYEWYHFFTSFIII